MLPDYSTRRLSASPKDKSYTQESAAMALTICPECNKELSTLASTCPHCGAPAPSQRAQPSPSPQETTTVTPAAEVKSKSNPTRVILMLVAIVLLLVTIGPSGFRSISTIFSTGAFESRERMAEGCLMRRVRDESDGLIRVASFTKTNGTEQEIFGIKAYKLDYTAEITFLEDCMWGGGAMGWDGTFRAVRGHAVSEMDKLLTIGKKPARKGQTERVSGSVGFQKTERGWQIR
jgi:hypothetical protein